MVVYVCILVKTELPTYIDEIEHDEGLEKLVSDKFKVSGNPDYSHVADFVCLKIVKKEDPTKKNCLISRGAKPVGALGARAPPIILKFTL